MVDCRLGLFGFGFGVDRSNGYRKCGALDLYI